jgi:hypothetical protein
MRKQPTVRQKALGLKLAAKIVASLDAAYAGLEEAQECQRYLLEVADRLLKNDPYIKIPMEVFLNEEKEQKI